MLILKGDREKIKLIMTLVEENDFSLFSCVDKDNVNQLYPYNDIDSTFFVYSNSNDEKWSVFDSMLMEIEDTIVSMSDLNTRIIIYTDFTEEEYTQLYKTNERLLNIDFLCQHLIFICQREIK